MPKDNLQPELTPQDRRYAVASILAKGLARWRKQVKSGRVMPDSGHTDSPETGLATCFEKGLSVSHDTHGLRLQDDGDDA